MSRSVNEAKRWLLRDGGVLRSTIAGQLMSKLIDEIAELEDAIRRIAEQDATLSVCDGAVTVTVDGTLTDAEKEAVSWAIFEFDSLRPDNGKAFERAATLRALLERHAKGGEA